MADRLWKVVEIYRCGNCDWSEKFESPAVEYKKASGLYKHLIKNPTFTHCPSPENGGCSSKLRNGSQISLEPAS